MKRLDSDILSLKIIKIFYQISLFTGDPFNYSNRNLKKKLLGIIKVRKNDSLPKKLKRYLLFKFHPDY